MQMMWRQRLGLVLVLGERRERWYIELGFTINNQNINEQDINAEMFSILINQSSNLETHF